MVISVAFVASRTSRCVRCSLVTSDHRTPRLDPCNTTTNPGTGPGVGANATDTCAGCLTVS